MESQHMQVPEQYQNASNLNARIQIHERFSTNKHGWHAWVFDQLRVPAEGRVLELGCGAGQLWLKNLERIPEGWDIILSDFSPGMLREAQRNLEQARRPFHFILADAQAIPFSDGRFDAVIANHMLYHVPDKERALAEIRRVLRRGSRFYASTVGEDHMRELDELTLRFASDRETAASMNSLIFPETFTLENGADQIRRWFGEVQMRRYEDALVVTEVESLVGYVLSAPAGKALPNDRLYALRKAVGEEIARHGSFYVTKDSGLFVAS